MRAIVLSLFLTGFAVDAHAQDLMVNQRFCQGNTNNLDVQIEACSSLLASGELSQDGLGIAYINRGKAYKDKGQFDLAIRDYGKAISHIPDSPYIYARRGDAYFRQGDFGSAIRDFDRAIALKPDFNIAYLRRGDAFYNSGKFGRAIQDFAEVIALA